VFDLYYSTKEAGTGLGLPIAKKIIDEHQGSLQIKSKENRGTSVSIEIPKKHASSLIKK
ncbi:MAG: ATP-binding protein, partial [Acidobacteriota bacterium]